MISEAEQHKLNKIMGGYKAAETNKQKYGKNFYAMIGSKGGQKTNTKPKGFAAMTPEKRREAGRKGGSKSSRAGVLNGVDKTKHYLWHPDDGKVAK